MASKVVLVSRSPAAYPNSWTGPWTLDSGLWTFPPKTLPP